MKIFKILSALLTYPTVELLDAVDEIAAAIGKERLLPPGERAALLRLLATISAPATSTTFRNTTCLLFDRTRSLSLHLFEHVHGESRDRGQAMVDLLALYEAEGLTAAANELPDFIPLFLEFLSTLEPAEARDLLGRAGHVFVALAERLRKRGIALRSRVRALVAMAEAQPDAPCSTSCARSQIPRPTILTRSTRLRKRKRCDFGPGDACGKDASPRMRQARQPRHAMARRRIAATPSTRQ